MWQLQACVAGFSYGGTGVRNEVQYGSQLGPKHVAENKFINTSVVRD